MNDVHVSHVHDWTHGIPENPQEQAELYRDFITFDDPEAVNVRIARHCACGAFQCTRIEWERAEREAVVNV